MSSRPHRAVLPFQPEHQPALPPRACIPPFAGVPSTPPAKPFGTRIGCPFFWCACDLGLCKATSFDGQDCLRLDPVLRGGGDLAQTGRLRERRKPRVPVPAVRQSDCAPSRAFGMPVRPKAEGRPGRALIGEEGERAQKGGSSPPTFLGFAPNNFFRGCGAAASATDIEGEPCTKYSLPCLPCSRRPRRPR